MSNNHYDDDSNDCDFSKKFKCEDCGSKFTTRYNLKRHIQYFHEEDDMSSAEKDNAESSAEEDNGESSADEDMSEDESEDEDVPVMFSNLVCDAINEHNEDLLPIVENYVEDGMTEKEATKQAFLESDGAKKTLRRLFTTNVLEIQQQRKHPLFKAIMEKAKELMDDGFDQMEALTTAVKYRKHAIYNLVKLL